MEKRQRSSSESRLAKLFIFPTSLKEKLTFNNAIPKFPAQVLGGVGEISIYFLSSGWLQKSTLGMKFPTYFEISISTFHNNELKSYGT